MRTPLRRRLPPAVPLGFHPEPGGLAVDFGPALHRLELDELLADMGVRWQALIAASPARPRR